VTLVVLAIDACTELNDARPPMTDQMQRPSASPNATLASGVVALAARRWHRVEADRSRSRG
jgi:hypothetical protein